MPKFKSVNFRIVYGTIGEKKIAIKGRLEIEFEKPSECDEFLKNPSPAIITVDEQTFLFSKGEDCVAIMNLRLSLIKAEIEPKLRQAVIDYLKNKFPEAYDFDNNIKDEETVWKAPSKKAPSSPKVNAQNLTADPLPKPQPLPAPKVVIEDKQKPKEQKNNPLDAVKKYFNNFFQHPKIRRLGFNIRLFFKMPSRFLGTLGGLTFLALGASLYFLSFSWTTTIPCAIFSGLLVSACTYMRNRRYEEAPLPFSKEENQAYDAGRLAGASWVAYLTPEISWLYPLHYGAGLVQTLDEEQTKAEDAWNEEEFKRHISPLK